MNIIFLKNFLFLPIFQDSVTPTMEGIIDLHNHIFFYLTLLLTLVFFG